MLDRRYTQAFLLLGLVMVLWAGNSIVARAVRFEVPPFTLAFLRWSGATLAVMPFAIRPLKRDWPAIRRGWKPLLFLGLMGIGAFNGLLYSGLQYTTATNALLPSLFSYFIYNHATAVVGPANAGQAITLMPLFGAFIAAAMLGERLHTFHFAGMACILAGIALSLFSVRKQEPAGAAKSAGLEDAP